MESAQPKTKSKRFLSVRIKLLIIFMLLFGIVFSAAFVWFYTFASGVAEARLNDNLTHALQGGAKGINAVDFVGLVNDGQRRADGYTDDQRFWTISDWLYKIHQIDPHAVAYAFVIGPKNADGLPQVTYIASSGAVDPDGQWGVRFKDPDTDSSGHMSPGLVRTSTFLNSPYPWEDPHTGISDVWVSGFTPITDSGGKTVGVLGIDYRFSDVVAVQQQVRQIAIPAFIVTLVIVFILTYLVANFYTRPIKRLTAEAGHIGEGKYDVDLAKLTNVRLPDEISTLAHVFSIMVDKVEKREVQLKERVVALEIQLDHHQRDQQVSEIVDSDFFQDLSNKADVMRTRRKINIQDEAKTSAE
jgi:HAMP domain-containing protein